MLGPGRPFTASWAARSGSPQDWILPAGFQDLSSNTNTVAPRSSATNSATYSLHSAVTSEDVASGNVTINITPLTDLVIANVANDSAADVFAKGGYASLLTKTALDQAVQALDTVLQPVLAQMGVPSGLDLLHQSFSANEQGLDAVLDAVKISIDSPNKTETITNRLNNSSTSGPLSAPPTTPLTAPSTNNLSDLQAITTLFNNFAATLAKASSPSVSDPGVQDFFSTSIDSHFLNDGESSGGFEQSLTYGNDQAKAAGGSLTFGDISLAEVPDWVSVPGATYMVSFTITDSQGPLFTVLGNRVPSIRMSMVVTHNQGNWLLAGNQWKVPAADIGVFEDNNGGIVCSGLQFEMTKGYPNDPRSIVASYAVITGPGLPSTGVLFFDSFPGNDYGFPLRLAGVPPAQYNGANTPLPTDNPCSFISNVVYVMSDAQIQAVTVPAVYTMKLYDDKGTPTDMSDDVLLATYTKTLPAGPVRSSMAGSVFPSGISANPSIVSTATAGGGSVQLSWTAPTTSGLSANWLTVEAYGTAACGDPTGVNVAGSATSANVQVRSCAQAAHAAVTLSYYDSFFRQFYTRQDGTNL